jgi:hypothetical protein
MILMTGAAGKEGGAQTLKREMRPGCHDETHRGGCEVI